MKVHFTDYFGIDPHTLAEYGAFNVSLINDLPLFIDPFLLFASDKPEYRRLHDEIIGYLQFLRDQSTSRTISQGLLHAWYMFPEVKQLWLGFSENGNNGSGLGRDFAGALNENLNKIFSDFGEEKDKKITHGTHLEKVCLISDRVGRDNVSDFTANLIKPFLCEYTQRFALEFLSPADRQTVNVQRAYFDYERQRWMPRKYVLPYIDGDYVLLTPTDILTKDENWINKSDLIEGLEQIAQAVPDAQLRAELGNYLRVRLRPKLTVRERRSIYASAIRAFPEVIDHYILQKEEKKGEALDYSKQKVRNCEALYVSNYSSLVELLDQESEFYSIGSNTLDEARQRVLYLKRVIESNGGYKLFYRNGKALQRESDLQILYRLTWYATRADLNAEVNNGRGPVDFTVSRGSRDKSLVEFKLAKNSKLKQNLKYQVAVYEQANNTKQSLKVIFYFTGSEKQKVERILRELKLENNPNIILIDVRKDNKQSASNAKSLS